MHKMFVEDHDCSWTFSIFRKDLIFFLDVFSFLIAWETSKVLKCLINESAFYVLILSDSLEEFTH